MRARVWVRGCEGAWVRLGGGSEGVMETCEGRGSSMMCAPSLFPRVSSLRELVC